MYPTLPGHHYPNLVPQAPPTSKKTRLTREDRDLIKRNPLGRKFHRHGSNFDCNGDATCKDTSQAFIEMFWTLQQNPVSRLLESNTGRAVTIDLADITAMRINFEEWPSVRLLGRAAALHWHDFSIWTSVLQIAVDLAKFPQYDPRYSPRKMWKGTFPMKNMSLRAMAMRNLGHPLSLNFDPRELVLASKDVFNQLLEYLEDGSGGDPPQIHQNNVLLIDAPERLGYHGLIVDTRVTGLLFDMTRECYPRPCEDCNRKFASHLKSALRRVIPWEPTHEDLDENELYKLSLTLDMNKRYRFCIHALWALFTFSQRKKSCEGVLLDYGMSYVGGMPMNCFLRHCEFAPELPLGRCNLVGSYTPNFFPLYDNSISGGTDFRPLFCQIKGILWKDSHTESDPRVLLRELIGALEDYDHDLHPEQYARYPGPTTADDWVTLPEIQNEWETRDPIEVEGWDELKSAVEYYDEMFEEVEAFGGRNISMSQESDDTASTTTTSSRSWTEYRNWAGFRNILDNTDAFVQKNKDILDFNKMSEDLLNAIGWKDGSS